MWRYVKFINRPSFQNKCGLTQRGVHPTGGSLRVFKQFLWLKLVPSKRRYLVPPTSGYASRRAVPRKIK